MTQANTQAAIVICRQAFTTLMVAYEAWLIAQDQYVSLGLGSVTDDDFADDLTAAEFLAAASDMATIMTAFTGAIKTNLRVAKQ